MDEMNTLTMKQRSSQEFDHPNSRPTQLSKENKPLLNCGPLQISAQNRTISATAEVDLYCQREA
jgi:hypothetical protein